MKKIMFHLNCLEQGGAERVVTNLSNQFAIEGYEVVVATECQAKNEFQLNTKIRRIHVGLVEQDKQKSRIAKYFIRINRLNKVHVRQCAQMLFRGFTHVGAQMHGVYEVCIDRKSVV